MKLLLVVLLWCVVWRSGSSQAWSLERAETDQSRIVFKNTTVTGKLMLCTWSWRDSLAGMWETSIRVSLTNSSYRSGHLEYRDGYGNEMLRLRWQQTPAQNLTWKALFASKFPPTSWNMSSDFLKWGYKPSSESTWAFYVDEEWFEPKPTSGAANPILLSPLQDVLGLWIRRRKRSLEMGRKRRSVPQRYDSSAAFSIMDLFSGDGILSSVPQMLINVFSFFANLFPPGDDGNYKAAEPDAEVMTTTRMTTTIVEDMALREGNPAL